MEDTYATIAAIIAGFGSVMLFFRIQRELSVKQSGGPNWIPWADWLLIVATLVSLCFVLLPIVAWKSPPDAALRVARAACAASIILVAGYVFGILAHYRLILGSNRKGPRFNPEPAERGIVWLTILLSILVATWILAQR